VSETAAAPLIPTIDTEIAVVKPLVGTVLRGLVWLGGARWAAQLFAWASTLIIARILSPDDYGLVAMAMVLTGFFEQITEMGLGAALVQSRDVSQRTVEATMGATCLLGLGAASLVALSAPAWAHIQGDLRIVSLVRALSLGIFLTAVSNVPYSMLHKRLAFGLVAPAQFAVVFVNAAVTLGAALIMRSYWALVVGGLAGKLTFTAMLIASEPVRPRLPVRGTNVGKLFRFGRVFTADRILNYARNHADIALVGALLGTKMAGIYVMATALARLPFEKLGTAFEPVAYPTFVRLRDNGPELRRFFLGLSLGTMAIAVPAAVGLIVTAPLLVPTILGKQWVSVVLPLQVAAVVTPLVFHLGIAGALLNALGRVDLKLRITTITSLLTMVAVFVGVRLGIVGVAAASAIAFALVSAYAEFLTLRLIDLRASELAKTLVPALSASLGMGVCLYATSLALPAAWPAPVRLVTEVAAGVVTFVAWALLLHRTTVVPQLRSLRTAWRSR
jgi:O-antigen/teichoic acid export membrane protein